MPVTKEQLQARAMEHLSQKLGVSPENLSSSATFSSLGLDSVECYDLFFLIENEFDTDIPTELARRIDSVDSLVDVFFESIS